MAGESREVLKAILPDIFADKELLPSVFIKKYWSVFETKFPKSELRGPVFELLLASTFCRTQLFPFYKGAQIGFIPGIKYDFVFYTVEHGPIVISAKTSLRERWKQADLEAMALKNVHRKSLSYLVTLDKDAVRTRREKEAESIGLNGFVMADHSEFDELIESLGKMSIVEAPEIKAIETGAFITDKNFKEHLH